MSPLDLTLLAVFALVVFSAFAVVAADRLGLWDRSAYDLTNDWLAAIVVGFGVVLGGVAVADRVPVLTDAEAATYIGASLLLLGGVFVTLGAGNTRAYLRLTRAAGPNVVNAEPGRVALSGTVEANAEGTVEAPLSGDQVVCYDVEIHDRLKSRNSVNTVHNDSVSRSFDLVDSTGRVRVDPEDALLSMLPDVHSSIEPGEEIPRPVREYLDSHGVAQAGEGVSTMDRVFEGGVSERVFSEKNLTPGDDAVVLGDARRKDGRLVVDGGSPFILDEGTLENATERYRTKVVILGPAGLVMALVGTGVLGLTF